jgi:hypothetical protein
VFLPDLSRVISWSTFISLNTADQGEAIGLKARAVDYLQQHSWCKAVQEEYAGLIYPGIIGVFLFRIEASREDVDEWIWVLVGDVPPLYLTCDICPNPATVLDAYVGAMSEWVDAVEQGKPVTDMAPVNAAATAENAKRLKTRLSFLRDRILIDFQDDLAR